MDAEDYEQYQWWKASERVIETLKVTADDENTVVWSQYWKGLDDDEKSFFAEVMTRAGRDFLDVYLKESNEDKDRCLRIYAGLLFVEYFEERAI